MLTQLRRDPRTIALIVVVPCLLVTLLAATCSTRSRRCSSTSAAPLLGLFPFITMFIVTSITMLRERVTGTLERLMTLPLAKLDLLARLRARVRAGRGRPGDGRLAARVRAARPPRRTGSHVAVVALAVGNAVLGMALGLFASAFARTEFQAVQFMPAIVFPQILLCGLFVARAQMAGWLRGISDALPLTYAYDALARVTQGRGLGAGSCSTSCVAIGATLLALALGAATLRRRTA